MDKVQQQMCRHLKKKQYRTSDGDEAPKKLVFVTESKLKNSRHAIANIFEIGDLWLSGDKLVVFLEPDAKVERKMFDRYGSEVSLDAIRRG